MGTAGPGLQEYSLIPHSFPHAHYSGYPDGNCMEDLWNVDVDAVYNGDNLLHVYCLKLDLHQDQ